MAGNADELMNKVGNKVVLTDNGIAKKKVSEVHLYNTLKNSYSHGNARQKIEEPEPEKQDEDHCRVVEATSNEQTGAQRSLPVHSHSVIQESAIHKDVNLNGVSENQQTKFCPDQEMNAMDERET